MDLNYTKLGAGCPLIILHGLYGSGSNWQTIGKGLSQFYSVYLLDQRNHGLSPHEDAINYPVMTEDLRHFMDSMGMEKACLMGHSMGGKVAMNFALQFPDRVEKLVVIDIALRSYMDEFQGSMTLQSILHTKIVEALARLDLDFIETREEADKELARSLPIKAVRQFLLKNLRRDTKGKFYWGLNLQAVKSNLPLLLDEVEHAGKFFNQPVLVISGKKSGYIGESDRADFRQTFPKVQIEELDAGHWVHSEQPKRLKELLVKFLGI